MKNKNERRAVVIKKEIPRNKPKTMKGKETMATRMIFFFN